MEIHFFLMKKSWKIIVEKEWSPCFSGENNDSVLRVIKAAVDCGANNVAFMCFAADVYSWLLFYKPIFR